MERLNFEDSWKVLRETTALVGPEDPFPGKVGPAGWGRPGSPIRYYKCPEFNIPAEGEEYSRWELENLTIPSIFLCRCGIEDISFRNTSLQWSSFCFNDFVEVDFTDADLSLCDLRFSNFEQTSFVRTDLRKADLRNSYFKGCDFTDANMHGAKLTYDQAEELPLSEEQCAVIKWRRTAGRISPGG